MASAKIKLDLRRLGDIYTMANFARNLKNIADVKQHVWLADTGVANAQTYEALAKPGVLADVKRAGIGHAFVDLPRFVGFVNDALTDGQIKPEELAGRIADNPSYSIYASRDANAAKPEVIAALMLRAQSAGVQLHFTGDSMLEGLEGKRMQGTVESEYIKHSLTKGGISLSSMVTGVEGSESKRREFMQQQMGVEGSVIANTAADITSAHRKQLQEAVGEVKQLPEGERALIIQQASMPIGMSVETMLGDDKVGRMEAIDLHSTLRSVGPAGLQQRLRNNGP